MNSFPKILFCRPLVPNAGCVDKTTNPYFKNEAEFVLVFKTNMLQYTCVNRNLQNYEEVCN